MIDISIIIPVYNSQLTIIESIESVINECLSIKIEWELILVDDGSSDNSLDIITNYVNNLPNKDRIKIISQPNGGAAVARNSGIKESKGVFIAFNDADDRWLVGKLKLQMDFMTQHPEVDLLGCNYGNDNFSIGSLIKLNDVTRITIKEQVSKNYFSPPTVILRKRLLEKAGTFNEKLRYAEEGYFFNNMVYNGCCYYMRQCVAEPVLAKERWGDTGLSGNLLKMEQGELYNIHSSYKMGYISFPRYCFAVCFSLMKFLRRVIISKYRKLWK